MKLRVAVCDDQPEVLESMKTILKETGLVSTVACYDNIRELREELQEGKMVDLLMMDICHELDSHMAIADQKKNGIDFAYELNQQFPFLQIIYITGYNDRYSQDIFLKPVRLAGFLTKPIQQDYVIKLLLLVQEKQKEDESEKLVVEGKGRQRRFIHPMEKCMSAGKNCQNWNCGSVKNSSGAIKVIWSICSMWSVWIRKKASIWGDC